MHITVIGANGKTGKLFVASALAEGYTVTACVRRLDTSIAPHKNLTLALCDVTDTKSLQPIIEKAEIVVSLLGHSRTTVPLMQTTAMQTLIGSNGAKNRRIISLTGTGVRIEGDNVKLVDKLVTTLLNFLDSKRMQDGYMHYKTLAQSDTPWTVLRVFTLGNGKLQPFTLRKHGPPQFRTSRATVCAAILTCIQSNTFVGDAPIISKN